MPAPTMETLAQPLSTVMSPPPMRLVAFFRAETALSASPRGTVKLMSLRPSRPVVCRMMSTLMFFWASRLKILKDIPGTSGTSLTVRTATSVSFATPLMSIPSTLVSSLTTVPGTGLMLEMTSSSTLYFLANSTLRLFSTWAPREASSSISSKVISFSLVALGILRGSAVKTPSTSVKIWQRSACRAAASATAEVSLPPRPRVVMSSERFRPWNPATTTTRLRASSLSTRSVSRRLMRALE